CAGDKRGGAGKPLSSRTTEDPPDEQRWSKESRQPPRPGGGPGKKSGKPGGHFLVAVYPRNREAEGPDHQNQAHRVSLSDRPKDNGFVVGGSQNDSRGQARRSPFFEPCPQEVGRQDHSRRGC